MKIRNGFVSNSSSSSFTCQVCGEECSGMDMCLDEAEMFQCQNGHTICLAHKLGEVSLAEKRKIILENKYSDDEQKDAAKDMNDEEFKEYWEDNNLDSEFELDYEAPASLCPICQLKNITDEMLVNLVLNERGISRTALEEEFRQFFVNYDNYKKATDKKS